MTREERYKLVASRLGWNDLDRMEAKLIEVITAYEKIIQQKNSHLELAAKWCKINHPDMVPWLQHARKLRVAFISKPNNPPS